MGGARCTHQVEQDLDCEQIGSAHPGSSAQCLYCQGNDLVEPCPIPQNQQNFRRYNSLFFPLIAEPVKDEDRIRGLKGSLR